MRKVVDLTGRVIGDLTVVKPGQYKVVGKNGTRRRAWECLCVCGKTVEVLASNLNRKNHTNTRSCGCRVLRSTKYNSVNLTGNIYGSLTVLRKSDRMTKTRGWLWVCQCSCGNEVEISSNGLTSGNNTTCGDKQIHGASPRIGELPLVHVSAIRQNAIKRNREFTVTPEYLWRVFEEQSGRCALSGVPLEFTASRNASSGRVETTASLDRIDNSKGYIEDNVRWVHKRVNIMRGNQTDDEFISWCLRCLQHARRSRDAEQTRTKWDLRWLDLAMDYSEFSKDPSTRVGSVIVDSDNRVVSFGYNGFPRNVVDSNTRLSDRETRLKIIQHAERNAVTFADRNRLLGSTIYVYPFMPCAQCAGQIIQTGIVRVVAPQNNNPRWVADFELASAMLAEAGVKIDLLDYAVI